jgi:hypothetical protein
MIEGDLFEAGLNEAAVGVRCYGRSLGIGSAAWQVWRRDLGRSDGFQDLRQWMMVLPGALSKRAYSAEGCDAAWMTGRSGQDSLSVCEVWGVSS